MINRTNRSEPATYAPYRWMPLVGIAALLVCVPLSMAEEGKQKPKRTPNPGIHWQSDFEAGMALAARSGRPILFALNALEDERANIMLATQHYRSKAWGDATRGFVCFVCNPNDHDGPDGRCKRYPGTTTACRVAALNYILRRFGPDQISPQHIILNPDGTLAYRKEYYTRVVGPKLFERQLANLAPSIAIARAAIARSDNVEKLSGTELDELTAAAEQWLTSDDPFAAGGVITVYEDTDNDDRRAALVSALAKTPEAYADALWHSASEFVPYPDDNPSATKGWVTSMLAAKRTLGAWAAAMAIARTNDEAFRNALLSIWAGKETKSIDALPADERPRAFEALALAGDGRAKKGQAASYKATSELWKSRIGRSLGNASARPSVSDEALADALASSSTPEVIASASRSTPEQLIKHKYLLLKRLNGSTHDPLRSSLAIALLRTKTLGPKNEVANELSFALGDPIEGPDTKRQLKRILKEVSNDADTDTWRAALTKYCDALRAGGAK